jgi:(2Fe-2S) ferredoxin
VNERPEDSPKGCCARCGGSEIRLRFVRLIKEHGLRGIVRANKSGCLDACELGAAIVIYPAGIWYLRVRPEDVDEIFTTSVLGDGVVERLAATPEKWQELAAIRKRKGPVK